MRSLRILFQILLFPVPWPIRRRLLRLAFGYRFDRGARIGVSIVDVRRLEMGPDARIGSFNLVHELENFQMGAGSQMGAFNWITGGLLSSGLYPHAPHRRPEFHMGPHSSITGWHRFDCADIIELGAFSTMGGAGSQVFTHTADVESNHQLCAPIKIGSHCLVTTRVVLLKGVVVADYCVVAAGSV